MRPARNRLWPEWLKTSRGLRVRRSVDGRGRAIREVGHRVTAGVLLAGALVAACGREVAWGRPREHSLDKWEVYFPNDSFKALDTFEAHSLTKADKAYNDKNYKQAHALYHAFTLEFGKSRAVPYALLRKGRCLHKLQKRFKAIEDYQEVLDYFPNRARYAAAALYYQGLCHWASGEEAKAMAKWTAMAKDADYSKHFLAAPALNQLASHLAGRKQPDKAAEYYTKVAVNFRQSNRTAAAQAMQQVIHHHVRVNPNEPGLRDFYAKVGTFYSYHRRKVEGDVVKNRDYWSCLRGYVKRYDRFEATQSELREKYFRYWADQMTGKFPDWDGFQIDLADFRRVCEKDPAKWFSRLDGQFKKYQKPGDYGRVLRWISIYGPHKKKVKEYYAKLSFGKMTNDQIFSLMKAMYDRVADADLARNAFGRLRLKEMPDAEKVKVARYLWAKDEALVERTCAAMADRDLGKMELLRYYRKKENAAKGVPLAKALEPVAKYAREALWLKAELLQIAGKYAEAIAAYKACDNPPDNIWGIAACYASWGKLPPAVRELRQMESFFRDRYGSTAALRIAHLYRRFKDKKKYVAELRAILKKYPESRQSSQAHVELENLGLTPGGGEDAKD